MAQKALAAVKNVLAKLPKIKAPWEVTGIASGAEYRDYLPLPTQYRVHSPGSQPIKPMVPAANPETVYDIKYWPRDHRREGMLVGGTNKKKTVRYQLDVTAQDAVATAVEDLTPGRPWRPGTGWNKRKNYLDNDNNGYTNICCVFTVDRGVFLLLRAQAEQGPKFLEFSEPASR